jgi:hypothetical protein
MTTFDKREEGFEKKFALDEEQKFKAVARRNRLLGLWTADRIGLTGSAADAYATDVVAAECRSQGRGRFGRQRGAHHLGRDPGKNGRTDGTRCGAGEKRIANGKSTIRHAHSLLAIRPYPSLKPYSGTLPLAP